MAGVKVYTTENCPYCRMVQAFLRKHDVEFEIVDVGKDREAAREMIAISGQRGVPVTVFGDEVVVGFDAKRLRELFGTPPEEIVHDAVIVGAGPAGLTSAVYCARKLMKTVVIAENVGGQAAWSWTIENYMGFSTISGEELVRKFEEQVRGFQVRLELESVGDVRKENETFLVRTASGTVYRSRTLILAPGKEPRRLGIPGEDRLMGKGVSICAICDAPLYRGKPVAVVGGGNAALQTAIEMTKFASSVALIVRRSLRCDEVYIDRAEEAGIRILSRHEVTALHGDAGLTGITIRDSETGEETDLDVEGLFLAIGLAPNTGFLKDLVALNEQGEIVIDENGHTSVPGVFAAGDATCVKAKQIIVAAGDGAKAALSAHEYFEELTGRPTEERAVCT
ncbi:FAD-dependent oxidoreductase [Methanoculleus chikugoensis]|uniref:Thioredoxin-disulfide reductase n=1 Tax=Methanoculleus chikugoensis TaxID=118126 RepID=A0ABM7H3J9_9EURY|nr:FAD-dependent oxidoreductase [Methanoculleus chikugoensis]BBL67159.1 thioredoxin-disulfide reductase [Methanoculleus chikugoensis]